MQTGDIFITTSHKFSVPEAGTRSVLWKKVFLKILQNSQGNTCARVSFLNKVAGLRPATLFLKRDSYTGVFL